MSNLNDVREKSIKVMLDKERHLKYDLNAWAEIEDRYGSIDKAMQVLSSGSAKAVRFMLWAGLIHEDESLTEKQVGAMISGINDLQQLIKALDAAMAGSLPQEAPEDPNVGKAQNTPS